MIYLSIIRMGRNKREVQLMKKFIAVGLVALSLAACGETSGSGPHRVLLSVQERALCWVDWSRAALMVLWWAVPWALHPVPLLVPVRLRNVSAVSVWNAGSTAMAKKSAAFVGEINRI